MKEKTIQLNIGKNWLNRLFATTLMIVVLLLVLSTATFAWYNVANMVKIDDISFTSSSRGEAGGDLCISWDILGEDDYEYNLPIHPVEEGKGLIPMIPMTLGTVNESTFDYVAGANRFNKATQRLNDKGTWVLKLEKNPYTTPYCLLQKDGEKNTFYLTNKIEYDMLVTVTYTIQAEYYNATGTTGVLTQHPIGDKVRIGIFTSDQPGGELILRGYGAKDGYQKIHYGVLQNNYPSELTEVGSRTGEITFVIPALSYVEAKVVVWFDGVAMEDEDGSREITLDINYLGVPMMPEVPEDDTEEEGGNQ